GIVAAECVGGTDVGNAHGPRSLVPGHFGIARAAGYTNGPVSGATAAAPDGTRVSSFVQSVGQHSSQSFDRVLRIIHGFWMLQAISCNNVKMQDGARYAGYFSFKQEQRMKVVAARASFGKRGAALGAVFCHVLLTSDWARDSKAVSG